MSRVHSLSFLKNTVSQIRFSSSFTGLRPRRSLLYVPGNETKKVSKAAGLSADVVVLDCEDGVAQSMKVYQQRRQCFHSSFYKVSSYIPFNIKC